MSVFALYNVVIHGQVDYRSLMATNGDEIVFPGRVARGNTAGKVENTMMTEYNEIVSLFGPIFGTLDSFQGLMQKHGV